MCNTESIFLCVSTSEAEPPPLLHITTLTTVCRYAGSARGPLPVTSAVHAAHCRPRRRNGGAVCDAAGQLGRAAVLGQLARPGDRVAVAPTTHRAARGDHPRTVHGHRPIRQQRQLRHRPRRSRSPGLTIYFFRECCSRCSFQPHDCVVIRFVE